MTFPSSAPRGKNVPELATRLTVLVFTTCLICSVETARAQNESAQPKTQEKHLDDQLDLRLVPDAAVAFARLLPQDAWHSHGLEGYRSLMLQSTDELRQLGLRSFGFSAADVTRVTLFVTPRGPEGDDHRFGDSCPVVIVRLKSPADRAAVLKALAVKTAALPHNGKAYHAPQNGFFSIHFATDRVLVYAEERAMKWFLDQPKRSNAKGPLRAAFRQAAGPAHLVIGINWQALMREARPAIPPQLKELAQAKVLVASVHVGDELRLTCMASFASAAIAEKAQRGVEILRAGIQKELAQAAENLVKRIGRRGFGEALTSAHELAGIRWGQKKLSKLPVKRDGNVLRAEAGVKPEGLLTLGALALSTVSRIGQSAQSTFEQVESEVEIGPTGKKEKGLPRDPTKFERKRP